MGKCQLCQTQSPQISARLGICLTCIRNKPEEALQITEQIHAKTRQTFNLPPKPPKCPSGLYCGMCANNCQIPENEKGYCGLVENQNNRLIRHGGTPQNGVLEWYYDGLPTNCVAWWFCPGCTGAGYPKYAYKPHAETGYSNLAVFYGSCSLDCLFCQNWHYRSLATQHKPATTAQELANKADSHVSCICYDRDSNSPVYKAADAKVACICFFGGDPSVQMPHALKTCQLALERARGQERILRICWETNGYWKDEFALKAAEYSLLSGGNIKFDLKTWDDSLSKALCGVSNEPTLRSFKMMGERFFRRRLDLPVLTASTLLIPGYIDAEEVENIARFISEIDPSIPYTLLAFYPQYVMNDLPTTSREQAERCYNAAKKHLQRVRIGNIHLLS